MPFGGDDWLALTPEPTLEPEMPICDPHHHFWDTADVRYLLDDLLQDTGQGHNIVSTVFIECESMYRKAGPEEMRPVGETEFVQGIAAQSASGGYGPTPSSPPTWFIIMVTSGKARARSTRSASCGW